jgi:cytoskeletal protein RodZ
MTTANEDKQENDLTALRKEKGLKLSDVAEKLKLTSDVIRKLENSEFENLAAYPYVRGYLINYANLLQTDPQRYIELIPKESKSTELVNTFSKSAKLIKFKRQSKGLGNYVIGTFIVLAVSFSGWYFLKVFSNKNELNQINANTSLQLSDQSLNKEDENQNLSLDDSSSNKENDSFHYSSLLPANDDIQAKDELDTNTIKESHELDSDSEQTNIIMDIETNSISIIDEGDPLQVKKYIIEVNALETSWIKIENSEGVKLFSDLFQPGKQVFESDSAIHFRIGNQSNVEVSINGEKIDISKYSRKNISDFDWPNIN